MIVLPTDIPEVKKIDPIIYCDERGYFFESFSQKEFQKKVFNTVFVQDNESSSTYGVLRGLHYQLPPFAQSKLVRVISGKVLDIAVDIRKGSSTFGKHVSIELSDENKKQFFIPRGFAHGFVVLSEKAVFTYKVDNYYALGHEASIRFDDPELCIDWKVPISDIRLSKKDCDLPFFSNSQLFDFNINLY